MTNLRLARGLHWRDSTPNMAELGFTAKNIGLIAGLILVLGITGTMDYADAQRAEAMAQEARADLNRAALLACLNGNAPGLYVEQPDGSRQYLVCSDPYYVSDRNIGRGS
jgi:hypothetical protein